MRTAYISYSRQDRIIANEVSSVLSQCGYRSFIDIEEELSIGSNFAEQLTRRLNDSDIVIYIVSEISLNSQWCRRELEYAKSKGKTIIPIATTQDILNGKSFQESVVSSLNGLVWDVRGREKLSSLLQSKSNEKQSRDISPSPCRKNEQSYVPSIPRACANKKSRSKIDCFVVILLIVILGAYFSLFQKSSAPKEISSPTEDEYDYSTPYEQEEIAEGEWVSIDSIIADSAVVDNIAADTLAIIEPSIDNEDGSGAVSPTIEADSTYEQETSIFENESIAQPSKDEKDGDYTWVLIILVIAGVSTAWWMCSKRKLRVKLVSNKDCMVFADNKKVASLTAKNVTFIDLPKGKYYMVFKPIDDTIKDKNITVLVSKMDELISMDFPESKSTDRNAIKCFIAGSTKLEAERNALRSGIAQTHNAWRGKNFEILSYTYEDFERKVVDGGHQSKYDEFIEKEATIAVFIISGEIGEFTITEFEKAMNAFKNGKHPQILVFNDINAPAHEQSDKLKAMVSAQKQYWADYDSINALKLQFMHTLDWMLIDMFYK